MHMGSRAVYVIVAEALVLLSSASAAQRNDRPKAMSPAGQAVFRAFYSTQNSAISKCLEDSKILEQQLIAEGLKSSFDWNVSKLLLKKQAASKARCNTIFQSQFMDLMDQLPASDRAEYYRNLYKPASPPPMTFSSTKEPQEYNWQP